MKFQGRSVVVSELDPVPEGLRFGPNAVVLNRREISEISGGRGAAITADLQEAMRLYDRERLRKILEDAGR